MNAKDVHLTKTTVRDLWDNGVNVMEIALSVFSSESDPKLRAFYDQEYERGIERDRKRKRLAGILNES